MIFTHNVLRKFMGRTQYHDEHLTSLKVRQVF